MAYMINLVLRAGPLMQSKVSGFSVQISDLLYVFFLTPDTSSLSLSFPAKPLNSNPALRTQFVNKCFLVSTDSGLLRFIG